MIREPGVDFWLPQFKWQLVDWLKEYDPSVNWNAKRHKQLMAIYISIQKKGGMRNDKAPKFITHINLAPTRNYISG
uniref:Uncharacterized protein n=1 Tax=viral metagenome TaxID=1070528 RepID=A0A6M3LBK3_9ZZZZ